MMNERVCNRIRQVLKETRGLSQKGLADCMGINAAAVNRMLYGQRNIKIDEIPIIENYIGEKLDIYSSEPSAINRSIPRAIAGVLGGKKSAEAMPELVPVYNEENETVDWAARHPAQAGINRAYALYVSSDAMEPRYFYGELVYIHPGRLPEMNKDCLLETQAGKKLIRRFLRQSEDKVYVAQLNPPKEQVFALSEVKAIYSVVGRN